MCHNVVMRTFRFRTVHNPMIVIVRNGQAELIAAPQDPELAWEKADQLTAETGVSHWVGRV